MKSDYEMAYKGRAYPTQNLSGTTGFKSENLVEDTCKLDLHQKWL